MRATRQLWTDTAIDSFSDLFFRIPNSTNVYSAARKSLIFYCHERTEWPLSNLVCKGARDKWGRVVYVHIAISMSRVQTDSSCHRGLAYLKRNSRLTIWQSPWWNYLFVIDLLASFFTFFWWRCAAVISFHLVSSFICERNTIFSYIISVEAALEKVTETRVPSVFSLTINELERTHAGLKTIATRQNAIGRANSEPRLSIYPIHEMLPALQS